MIGLLYKKCTVYTRQAFGFLQSKKQPSQATLALLLMVAFFVALLTIRAKMIHFLGVEVPFWDQWDGEVERLYFKYLDSSLGLRDFFLPANEHRIFYTRVLNLVVFIWNDNTLSTIDTMLAQNIVICIAIGFVSYVINRDHWRVVPTVFLFVAYALPLGPENQFWGYQSQVYFVLFFLVIASWLISSKKIPFIPIAVISVLAAASMGSAFLIAGIAALRSGLQWLGDRAEMKNFYKALGFLILSVILTQVIWHNPAHEVLQAKGISEFLHRLYLWYSWPQEPYPFFGRVSLFLFAVLLLVRIRIKLQFSRIEIFSLSLVLFVVFLAIIGSFSRPGVAVRYHDYILMALFGIVLWSNELLNIAKNNLIKISALIIWVFIFSQILGIAPKTIIDASDFSRSQDRARHEFMYALQLRQFGEKSVSNFFVDKPNVLFPVDDVLVRIIMDPRSEQIFKNYK